MKRWLIILTGLFLWLLVVGMYGLIKPLPENLSMKGALHSVPSDSIHFFSDATYMDEEGARHSQQEIFDEIIRMIDAAQHYVLIDMFFYSDFLGAETSSYRQLSNELTQALVAKKQADPDISIQVLTDPINVMYGGHKSQYIEELHANDIPVIITDLRPLRDSNPLYSVWWRTFFQWLGNSDNEGFLPHPLDAQSPSLGIRTYLSIFNYKANHRKVVMADFERDGDVGLSVLTTSANPHDGSSAHSNTAIRVDEHLWKDALTSERAVADFSQTDFLEPPEELIKAITDESGTTHVQLLTEGAIEDTITKLINKLQDGDSLDMAMFYIADRDVVKELKEADRRGVTIRLLLDPNKDAFGREKNGMPNRQVAYKLMQHTQGNTQIRWCNTHGEQCHSKILIIKDQEGYTVIQGSANLTRRNIGDFNLETNTLVFAPDPIPAIDDTLTFFEKNWSNELGKIYSVDYSVYEDQSKIKTITYRIKEFLGTNRW